MEKEELYQFLNTGERMQLKGLVKPQVEEPAEDSKKFEETESVPSGQQSSSEAAEKHDFDSMIRRDGDKLSCIKCGKVSWSHTSLYTIILILLFLSDW